MKINYELVDKLGATHYSQGENRIIYYKIVGSDLYANYYYGCNLEISRKSAAYVLTNLKKIPPKPPVRVDYEKVDYEAEEIWKAFQEHQEKGHLFVRCKDGYENLGDGVFNLAMAISEGDQLYRRTEKPVDWRDEVVKYLRSRDYYMSKIPDTKVLEEPIEINQNFIGDEFLEMCRVALRANGEL